MSARFKKNTTSTSSPVLKKINKQENLVQKLVKDYETIHPTIHDANDMGLTESCIPQHASTKHSKRWSSYHESEYHVKQFREKYISDNDSDKKVNKVSNKDLKNIENIKKKKEELSDFSDSDKADNFEEEKQFSRGGKYASIGTRKKLRDRFYSCTDLNISSEIDGNVDILPPGRVKDISKLFEQRCQNNLNKPYIIKSYNTYNTDDSEEASIKCAETTYVNCLSDSESIDNGSDLEHDEEERKAVAKDRQFTNVEDFRKSIVAELSKSLDDEEKDDDLDSEFNEEVSDEEFHKIEDSFHEMENAILEMKAHHFDIQKDTKDEDESTASQLSQNSENENVSDKLSDFEMENLEKHLRGRGMSLDSNEYFVIVEENDKDEEDIFGTQNFENLEDINFVEAYNRPGSELILTQVGQILRRSISRDQNGILNLPKKPFSKETQTSEYEDLQMNEQPERVEIHNNTIINNYFYDNSRPETIQSESETTESEVPSNRSTMYSVSEDENIKFSDEDNRSDENYEDIELRDGLITFDRGIRTETYYNSLQNPVIEKVCNLSSGKSSRRSSKTKSEIEEKDDDFNFEREMKNVKEKRKKDYLIEELVSTEEKYISDLEKVVKDYMPYLTDEENLPRSTIGRSWCLFGNIKRIYSRTKKFYDELRNCNGDYELIAEAFLDFEHLFELYPIYSKNKPKSDYYLLGEFKEIVAARQKHLGDRLGLASYLLTPVQRLGKYILLLEQIQKELTKEGTPSNKIQRAIEMVRRQMSRGNDFIAIDSIKESPINLTEEGSFIMREKFNIIKPRKFEAMLFLFEEIIVFTSPDLRNPEMFIYRDSIRLNEMGIVTFEDQPLVFHLKRFPSYKTGTKEHHEFVIEAKRKKDKKVWTEQIEKRLWEQLVKCKEEQKKLHSKEGRRVSTSKVPERRYKPASSTHLSKRRKERTKSIFYYSLDNYKEQHRK